MYNEKLRPLLLDLENKEVEIAGGSVVGMSIATVNSLIIYICNLTLGKKKYESVEDEVNKILNKAQELKNKGLKIIDEDRDVLEKILSTYKLRNENMEDYINACKDSVEFCLEVLNTCFETLKLSNDISKVGNKMLSSDFKISKYYSYSSIKSAIVNVNINLDSIEDKKYKNEVNKKVNKILKEVDKYMEGLD